MSQFKIRLWAFFALPLLAVGCASTIPAPVFQPKAGPGVHSFFRNGAAIGAIDGDSSFVLAQVEPVTMAGARYLRLWLLVENRASTQLEVAPLKCTSLRVESIGAAKDPLGRPSPPLKGKSPEITPTSPTKMLATISNAKASSAILRSIGAALEASAQRPTRATTTGDGHASTTTINDLAEKQRATLDRRGSEIAAADAWYESFRQSVNVGILRRNTLFPGEGVNGYVYFKLPASGLPRLSDRRYVVTLTMPGAAEIAAFEPIEGE